MSPPRAMAITKSGSKPDSTMSCARARDASPNSSQPSTSRSGVAVSWRSTLGSMQVRLPDASRSAIGVTASLIGFLFLVEITSGIIQGFYVPLIPDLVEHLGIRDADFNWFEAAQLLL